MTNPHIEAAQSMLATSHEEPLLHREVMAAQALVEATLALAHEQARTTDAMERIAELLEDGNKDRYAANLIAYQGNVQRSPRGMLIGDRTVQDVEINRTIQERLGIE